MRRTRAAKRLRADDIRNSPRAIKTKWRWHKEEEEEKGEEGVGNFICSHKCKYICIHCTERDVQQLVRVIATHVEIYFCKWKEAKRDMNNAACTKNTRNRTTNCVCVCAACAFHANNWWQMTKIELYLFLCENSKTERFHWILCIKTCSLAAEYVCVCVCVFRAFDWILNLIYCDVNWDVATTFRQLTRRLKLIDVRHMLPIYSWITHISTETIEKNKWNGTAPNLQKISFAWII